MPCPNSARKRNKTMAFRLTPEEHALLCERITISGLNRQEYIYRKLMDMEVVVKPSVRVHKALKESMGRIYQQLLRIRAGGTLSGQMETVIEILAEEFSELGPATEESEIDKETKNIWNLTRD